MKKLFILKLFLVVIIIVALSAFLKASYDDDELTFDALCNNNNLLYACFLFVLVSCSSILCVANIDFTYREPFVSFLASKEKSPPGSSCA